MTASAARSAQEPARPADPADMLRAHPPAGGFADVAEVVAARAVHPVFQPLVHLDSGAVVGYEALARGPAGTPWHAPAALFAAARQAGLAAELDWVCRARAYAEALAAGLDPRLSLFVNCEPVALRTPCPPDLLPIVARAQDRLRVVTEVTERAIGDDPAGLLGVAGTCRRVGWGVALDDVGADPASLALMPFVQPDVVKLDMHLLHHPDEPKVAQVVTAVLSYAERSGATILAEGIETPRHRQRARSMGATVGQGWLFGRPGPLPAAVPIGPTVPLLVAPVRPGRTPFEVVSAARPVTRATKAELMPISRYLESRARDHREPPVLLACFQHARHFTPATARRFAGLTDGVAMVVALGAELAERPAPGVRGARLGPDDPLCGEWNVLVVGPHFAVALVARDLGDTGPDAQRRFDHVVTHDRGLVLDAARTLLPLVSPVSAVPDAGQVRTAA